MIRLEATQTFKLTIARAPPTGVPGPHQPPSQVVWLSGEELVSLGLEVAEVLPSVDPSAAEKAVGILQDRLNYARRPAR